MQCNVIFHFSVHLLHVKCIDQTSYVIHFLLSFVRLSVCPSVNKLFVIASHHRLYREFIYVLLLCMYSFGIDSSPRGPYVDFVDFPFITLCNFVIASHQISFITKNSLQGRFVRYGVKLCRNRFGHDPLSKGLQGPLIFQLQLIMSSPLRGKHIVFVFSVRRLSSVVCPKVCGRHSSDIFDPISTKLHRIVDHNALFDISCCRNDWPIFHRVMAISDLKFYLIKFLGATSPASFIRLQPNFT